MKRKLQLGTGVGILIFLLVSAGFYILSSENKTPELTFIEIENSIKNHDRETFYKFVDIDGVLNSSCDEILGGMADSDKTMSIEAREAVKNFTQMLKAPLVLTLKTAIDNYVASGKFNEPENLSIKEILSKTGIDKIEYRGVEKIFVNDDESVANIKIFHPELGNEFILNAVLKMTDEGDWKIIRLLNFREFVTQIGEIRRNRLDQYLAKTEEINSVHDKIIRDAESKYNSILSKGSLGQKNIRAELKKLMLDVVKKDWENRKQEIFNLNVPQDAQTLHSLRIKICDLEIGYAEEYATWMTDKKASTIKSAEEKRRQAQTLMTEANVLARRMTH